MDGVDDDESYVKNLATSRQVAPDDYVAAEEAKDPVPPKRKNAKRSRSISGTAAKGGNASDSTKSEVGGTVDSYGRRPSKKQKRATLKTEPISTSKQQPFTFNHPTLFTHDTHILPEPADGFPNWFMRRIPRPVTVGRTKADTFYYSPKLGLRFRSKPEVQRFLAVLKSSRGDEAKAIVKFKFRERR